MENENTEILKQTSTYTIAFHSAARKQLVVCIVRECKKRMRFDVMAEVADDTTVCAAPATTITACDNVAQEEKANFLVTSEYGGTSLSSRSLMLLLLQARFFLSCFLSWIR
jgi:hypothetical protein